MKRITAPMIFVVLTATLLFSLAVYIRTRPYKPSKYEQILIEREMQEKVNESTPTVQVEEVEESTESVEPTPINEPAPMW